MLRLWSGLALAAMGLAACATPPVGLGGGAWSRPASVAAEARIALQEAPKAAAAFHLLGGGGMALTPNDATTLARIEVWLSRNGGTPLLLGNLGGAERSLTLNALKLDSGYQVLLKGFKADPNLASDPSFSMKISQDDASSASFRTDPDASGAYALNRNFNLPLVLSNQVFSGTAAGGIVVTPGLLDSTAQPEALATGGV